MKGRLWGNYIDLVSILWERAASVFICSLFYTYSMFDLTWWPNLWWPGIKIFHPKGADKFWSGMQSLVAIRPAVRELSSKKPEGWADFAPPPSLPGRGLRGLSLTCNTRIFSWRQIFMSSAALHWCQRSGFIKLAGPMRWYHAESTSIGCFRPSVCPHHLRGFNQVGA